MLIFILFYFHETNFEKNNLKNQNNKLINFYNKYIFLNFLLIFFCWKNQSNLKIIQSDESLEIPRNKKHFNIYANELKNSPEAFTPLLSGYLSCGNPRTLKKGGGLRSNCAPFAVARRWLVRCLSGGLLDRWRQVDWWSWSLLLTIRTFWLPFSYVNPRETLEMNCVGYPPFFKGDELKIEKKWKMLTGGAGNFTVCWH